MERGEDAGWNARLEEPIEMEASASARRQMSAPALRLIGIPLRMKGIPPFQSPAARSVPYNSLWVDL